MVVGIAGGCRVNKAETWRIKQLLCTAHHWSNDDDNQWLSANHYLTAYAGIGFQFVIQSLQVQT